MNTDNKNLNEITQKIIGCAYMVSNALGCGFLEKVYENALAHELRKAGLAVEQQRGIQVHYDGIVVGDYVADLLVEKCILVELKTVQAVNEVHMAQCMNYLKATGLHICLLMNFAKPKVEIRRIVLKLDETADKRSPGTCGHIPMVVTIRDIRGPWTADRMTDPRLSALICGLSSCST